MADTASARQRESSAQQRKHHRSRRAKSFRVACGWVVVERRLFCGRFLSPTYSIIRPIADRLNNHRRMTLLQAGRDLLARGGVPELYQGLGVTLIGSMPAVGVYFGLYQFVKKQMDGKEGMSPYVSITVSAGVGNFIAR